MEEKAIKVEDKNVEDANKLIKQNNIDKVTKAVKVISTYEKVESKKIKMQ